MEEQNPLRNIVSSQYKYKGAILNLRVDQVKFPSGLVKPREIIEHKDAVAVLVVNSKNKIILVSQYRHAVDDEMLELPAGLIDEGETPSDAAIRELREEIGYMPKYLEQVFETYSSPGYSTEKLYIFYAHDLVPSKLQEDDDEYIRTFEFTPEEIEKMISIGSISDSKTIAAYYWYVTHRIK